MILVSRKKYDKVKEKLDLAYEHIKKITNSLETEQRRNYTLLEDKSEKEDNYLKSIETLESEKKQLCKILEIKENIISTKELKIMDLNKKLRISNSSRGGMQRKINTLTKELAEYKRFKKILKVTKVRSCKATTQKMKYPKIQTNSVRKALKEIDNIRKTN